MTASAREIDSDSRLPNTGSACSWLVGLAVSPASLRRHRSPMIVFDSAGQTVTSEICDAGNGSRRSIAGPTRSSLARQSLAGYDSFVNQAIKDWEVPGVAIAIVKNGEVILAGGFGMRDVAGKLPVTSQYALRHRIVHQGVHHVRHGHARRRRQARLGQAGSHLRSRNPAL